MKVILTLDEKQASVLQEALELYERLGMGQLDELRYFFMKHRWKNIHPPHELLETEYNDLDDAALFIKAAMFKIKGHGLSYGIRSQHISEVFRVAYDIQQVLRHAVSWNRNPGGGMTVDFQEPMKTAEGPLPIVTIAP